MVSWRAFFPPIPRSLANHHIAGALRCARWPFPYCPTYANHLTVVGTQALPATERRTGYGAGSSTGWGSNERSSLPLFRPAPVCT